jgi:hypothetical protein
MQQAAFRSPALANDPQFEDHGLNKHTKWHMFIRPRYTDVLFWLKQI